MRHNAGLGAWRLGFWEQVIHHDRSLAPLRRSRIAQTGPTQRGTVCRVLQRHTLAPRSLPSEQPAPLRLPSVLLGCLWWFGSCDLRMVDCIGHGEVADQGRRILVACRVSPHQHAHKPLVVVAVVD